jgi:site-specific DNA-methyltransferase (adenine-specific)
MKVTDKITITNEDNMALMSRYEDNHFDLAIVDPPYGLDDWNERGTNKKHMDKKHMDLDKIKGWEMKPPQQEYFDELQRVSKNQIIWGGNHFLDYLGSTKEFIIWDKKIRGMHFNDCELAWCNGIKSACRIFSLSANQNNRIHPTQKPVKLYEWILNKYAEEKNKIIDTHLGSGSIAMACHNFGYELTACELDKEYYNDSIKRIKDHISQQRLF